jgi:hypothetical protein
MPALEVLNSSQMPALSIEIEVRKVRRKDGGMEGEKRSLYRKGMVRGNDSKFILFRFTLSSNSLFHIVDDTLPSIRDVT